MRTWTTQTVDVRHDPTIAADVADFLRKYGVKHTVTSDRIMGCPHQEGIDYSMGRSCLQCPFWAGIDRFTGERRAVPTPTLSPSAILTTLFRDASVQPTTRGRSRNFRISGFEDLQMAVSVSDHSPNPEPRTQNPERRT